MKRLIVVAAVTALALVALAPAGAAKNADQRNFVAPMSGDEEVPPVDTQGTGVAKFQLSQDGDELHFFVNLANLTGVVAGHIHCAPAGVNGAVAVTLFAGAPTGAVHGRFAQGVITALDATTTCDLDDLDDLVAAMRSGDAYVNIHTLASLNGEIRGQLK